MSAPTPILMCGPKVTVDLQHLVASSDSAGSYVETYTTYASVPALMTALSGQTKYMDEKMTEIATHSAYIAYRGDILPSDRLCLQGRHYFVGMATDPFNQMKLLKINLKLAAV
jgi:SPP1 family predicted phage head-tail adaptor